MPQALSATYLHVIFSTKERRPFLRDPVLRNRLHEYLGGVSKQLDCHPVRIGGVEDHVHLLCRLSRTISMAEWIKELKRVSSLWIKQADSAFRDFAWQGGYAAFSVSVSNLQRVERYIANQESHHRRMSFQDELRLLLEKHKIEWDERYLWD
jgi:putative transposase